MSTVFAFDDVSAGYKGRNVLKNLTASFAAGTVTGLLGPNGAGKTTLFRVALRLLPINSGSVCLLDRSLSEWSPQALARTVAYLPQEAEAHWPVQARKLVALGRLPHRDRFARLSEADEEAIQTALSRCDALPFATRAMSEISAGERARVLLARALAVQAPVLLADEPAAHLDPSHQLGLMQLLQAEARRGIAVVVTLHDLTLASRFCDNIIVLHGGRAMATGASSEALSDKVIESVFAIRAERLGAAIIPWNRREVDG